MEEKPQSAHIHPGPGFRVGKTPIRPKKSLLKAFGRFGTPDISDQLNRLYTMSHRIHNMINDKSIVGSAITVKVFPGDNLMVHKALDLIQPGDILVIDNFTGTTNAVIGDLIANKALHLGVVGFVVDGLIRDVPELLELGLPIFAKGVTPIGPLQRGPGEINCPISCGGVVVNSGDIIVADSSGVVVIKQDFATLLLKKLQAKKNTVAEYEASVRRGEFSNAWVEQALNKLKCQYE